MTKVLIVLGSMHNGGTEAFVMNYFRNIDKEHFKMDFLVVSGSEEYYRDEITLAGGQVYHLSYEDKGKIVRDFFLIKKILTHHKQEYDVIHIQSCSLKSMLQPAMAAKISGCKKIIGHSHSVGEPQGGMLDNLSRMILKTVLSGLLDYGFACSSDSGKGKYTNTFISSRRYAIIPNAIDTDKYKFNAQNREEIRLKYNLNNSLVLGIVGRLEREKNHCFLLDSIAELSKSMVVKFLIIGDGYTKKDIIEKAQRLEIMDSLVFTGAVSDVERYYSAMDLFCLPSFAEGFPFVIVEAQANGLKCLVSSGITEETNISDEVEYIPIDDSEAWTIKFKEFSKYRMGNDAVCRVKEKYDIRSTSKLLECYYIE